MSVVTGSAGLVSFSGGAYSAWADTFANIFAFTYLESNTKFDSTIFTGTASLSEGKTSEYGPWTASGRIRAFLDRVSVPTLTVGAINAPGATPSTLTLQFNSGNTKAFLAHLFDIEIGVDRSGAGPLNILNCSYQSSGDLTVVRPAS